MPTASLSNRDSDDKNAKRRRDSSQFLVKLHSLLDGSSMEKDGIRWNDEGDGQ
jgi:hypothetical protein